MIRDAIYSILSADTTLTALTSRISHGIANQEGNMPYVTFMVYDTDPNPTKDTLSEVDIVYLAVNCISQNNRNCILIAEAVRSALDGYSGTISSTTIQSITFQKLRDNWMPEAKAYQLVLDFQIFEER